MNCIKIRVPSPDGGSAIEVMQSSSSPTLLSFNPHRSRWLLVLPGVVVESVEAKMLLSAHQDAAAAVLKASLLRNCPARGEEEFREQMDEVRQRILAKVTMEENSFQCKSNSKQANKQKIKPNNAKV